MLPHGPSAPNSWDENFPFGSKCSSALTQHPASARAPISLAWSNVLSPFCLFPFSGARSLAPRAHVTLPITCFLATNFASGPEGVGRSGGSQSPSLRAWHTEIIYEWTRHFQRGFFFFFFLFFSFLVSPEKCCIFIFRNMRKISLHILKRCIELSQLYSVNMISTVIYTNAS